MRRRARPDAASRARGAILAVVGATLGASCGPPPPRIAPPGHGWYCFSPHPRHWYRLAPSCFREKPACEAALAQAIDSEAAAVDAGVADEPKAPFQPCTRAPIAWCFHYRSELIAEPEPHFVCAATACDCEREQTSGWTDISVSRTCDHAE